MSTNFWNATRINKGEVKQGTSLIYEFEYSGDKKIIKVTTSCGCTAASENGNKVRATLSTELPYHLEKQDYNKGVTVYFADGSTQELRLLATVKR